MTLSPEEIVGELRYPKYRCPLCKYRMEISEGDKSFLQKWALRFIDLKKQAKVIEEAYWEKHKGETYTLIRYIDD